MLIIRSLWEELMSSTLNTFLLSYIHILSPQSKKAMDFVETIVDFAVTVEDCLSCHLLMKQFEYIVKAKRNVENLASFLEALRAYRDDVQKIVDDAEKVQKKTTNEVEFWLKKVRDIEAKVDITITNYEHRGCRLFGDCSLNCWSTYKFGREAARLLIDMADLKMVGRGICTMQPIKSTPLGLNRYVETVRNYLIDDNVSVIAIDGMGGVGKTTLLKEINNSLLVENLGFKYLIWVVVSEEFQLIKVQAQVAQNLQLKLNDKDDVKENAKIIFNYLKDKSFLLMLDDIRERFEIVGVGIPDTYHCNDSNNHLERRQKVILTTRLRQVCGQMLAERIIVVECLSKLYARNLFKKTLGEWCLKADVAMHRLIEEVADECAGLPLALIVVARAMSSRKTIQEWQEAIASLKKSLAGLKKSLAGEDLVLFSTLKFSYDSLKNDALRKCFLYCSLWPQNHDIEKDELIGFCIGIGLIKDFDNITKAYDKGRHFIEDLMGACLLESGSNDQYQVKMHDIIRDFALWIASDCGVDQKKWLVKSGIGLLEVQLDVEKWKEVQVVSLMYNRIEEFPSVPFKCPNISHLILKGNHSFNNIRPSTFQNMRALTILSLESTSLYELPESIGMLTMLRYLDLSHSKLRSLPRGLRNLSRLSYLGLYACPHLQSIPAGVISGFVELEVFDLSRTRVDAVLEDCPEVVRNDRKKRTLIDEVERLPRGLKGFGVDLWSDDAFRHLSILSHVFTWRLRLLNVCGLSTIQLKHNMWSSLRRLELYGCNDAVVLEFVADCEGTINSSNHTCPIESLEIDGMSEIEDVMFRGVVTSVFFQRLERVVIWGCDRLKNINWTLGLQSLAHLELRNCKGIECLMNDIPGKGGEIEEVATRSSTFNFPSLKILRLTNLAGLRSICCGSVGFPALQELMVYGCPNLKKLAFPSNNNKLRVHWR